MDSLSSFDELFNSGKLPSKESDSSKGVSNDREKLGSAEEVESLPSVVDDGVLESVDRFADDFFRDSLGLSGEEEDGPVGGQNVSVSGAEDGSTTLPAIDDLNGGARALDSFSSAPEFKSEVVEHSSIVEDSPVNVIQEVLEESQDEVVNDLDAMLLGEVEVFQEEAESIIDLDSEDWSDSGSAFDSYIDEDDVLAVAARDFKIDKILTAAIALDASDIHIYANDEIIFRILGKQVRQPQFGQVTPQICDYLVDRVSSFRERESLVIHRSLDTSYTIKSGPKKGRRTRLNISYETDRPYFVFRIIADQIKTVDELGVPKELLEWTNLNSGLVLMNGPTGSGKSTTLASLVQNMLDKRPHHIITLEKPIEYIFTPTMGTVVQRNVGSDARTFKEGLTAAMRGDPDIIMVGEVRNREEVDAVLEATETGHLTISTMHTKNASGAIDRIASMYSGDELKSTLEVLSSVSMGFANQLLLITPDGTSRLAAREILPINEKVRDLIAEGDSRGIYQYQWDKGITMEHELVKMVNDGAVDLSEARYKCSNIDAFDRLVADTPKSL